jgi:hypothetical protein
MKTLRIIVISVLLTGIILMSAVTWVFAQDNNIIHACVAKDGSVRIAALEGKCKDKETPLQWNVQGEQGPAGVLGFYTVRSETDQISGFSFNATTIARCEVGDRVTGGGYQYFRYKDDGSKPAVLFSEQNLLSSYPEAANPTEGLGEGWRVHVLVNQLISGLVLEVSAICADITP